ncbi:MAG: hypothetical protein AABW87_02855 [Nanoarchaeota archaeon]
MRKLVSKEEEARKKKRTQTILVVFLALIMIVSTIGFAIQSDVGNTGSDQISGNEAEYNGFKFVNQNGLWVLGNFVFKYTPQQVPDISPVSAIKLKTNYQEKPAYVYSEDEGAEAEIIVNLGQIAQRVQKACPENTICENDLPVKTCNDNFIIIKESNIGTGSIRQDNNCVFIEGKKEDLAALADQFLFKILEVR